MSEPLLELEPQIAEPGEEVGRSLRVLVVVDDAIASRAIREALDEDAGGVDVEWLHAVDGALSTLSRQAFDVVVLDAVLVGNRALALVEHPAIVEGDAWLALVAEPAVPGVLRRRLLAAAAHETLPRDERLAESLAGLLRFARRSVAVRARASRYQSLFRHSADGILLFDERGNVRDANPRALEQRLQEVQKMEALGRLASGVAHDLNNLLTVIQGYCALLEKVVPEGGEARRFLDEVTAAGQRASSLTHQLLAFSRRQVLQPRLVDMNEEIARLARLLRPTLGEDVRLELELQAELPRVRIDPAQLEQVIVNLAVNARDAMPGGGRLTLGTSEVPAPGPLAADDPQAGAPWVRLQARDTGVGMSADVLAHLFEPFFTTKERGKGTGLGLASVYGAVRQSGGDIRVQSVPGTGTTFEVLLPPALDDAPLTDTGSHPAMARPAPRGGERVLVVEDDTAVRGLVAAVLRGAGYAVDEAADGEAALALAGARDGAFDLLLCDVVLPDGGGDEVSRRVAGLHPGVRTLFMSGHAPRAIARQGRLRPGSRFIAKPFTP
ncbi:MAG TPA: response regulator, partial [Thermoanaerobaculia bacterium]|nr:response regulator [Thermoanaerobaculia bacterium]